MAALDPVDWTFKMPRLRARLIDAGDRDLYRALYTDPAMMAHIGAVLDVADADAMFDKVVRWNREVPMRARYWRVERRDDGEAVGMQSILRVGTGPDVIELGLMILPYHQGLRYGLEVTTGILTALFGRRWSLETEVVVARHMPANLRIEKMGVVLRFEKLPSTDDAAHAIRLSRAAWEDFLDVDAVEGETQP